MISALPDLIHISEKTKKGNRFGSIAPAHNRRPFCIPFADVCGERIKENAISKKLKKPNMGEMRFNLITSKESMPHRTKNCRQCISIEVQR